MKSSSYKKAGVDLKFANSIIPRIGALIRKTRRPEVLADIGPFAALFELRKYKKPVIVSSADGVGTKAIIALKLRRFGEIGVDLVAMNMNDVLAMGAEPLFFLDYIGIGGDQKSLVTKLIRGMARGCKMAGCSLIGGEVAEMPAVYGRANIGLSGFAVGIVEKNRIIDGRKISAGDVILGLASSGLHANGFSLVNKIFRPQRKLLKPTRIYTRSVLSVLNSFPVHGLAHITGGGIYDNIGRILPKNLNAEIRKGTWPMPKIFLKIQEKTGLTDKEMFHVFNMGIGFIIILLPKYAPMVIRQLSGREKIFCIGYIKRGNGQVVIS